MKLLDAVALPPEPEGLGGGVVTLTARVTVAPACGVRVAAWRVVMVLLLVLVTTPLLAAGSRLGEGLVAGDREALLVVPEEGLEVAVNDRVLVLLGVLVLVLDRETLRVLVGDRDVDLDLEGVREGDRVRVDVDVSLDVDVALEVAVSLEVEVPVAVPVPVPVVEGVGDVVTDGEELGLEE